MSGDGILSDTPPNWSPMGEYKRSVCRAGLHKMEEPNLVHRKDGTRECKACRYERINKQRRDKRAEKRKRPNEQH